MSDNQRLWEIQHRYHCQETNYFAGRRDTVTEYCSWQQFIAEMGDADEDYNLLFRWDWRGSCPDNWDYDPTAHDENCRDGRLYLFWMGQRKGKYYASIVNVCRADEPQVVAFLRPRFEHLKGLWEPLK